MATRLFDGITYTLRDTFKSKRDAVREAKDDRREGYSARIVKASNGYQVWWKFKGN